MAIYHLNFRRCSKNKNQSAKAKYDYINRQDKYNKNRDDLIYAESANIPSFAANNPRDFWIAADEYERANARVCTEIEFALPRELDLEQQKALINEFIKNNLDNDNHKLAYSYAIHNDKDNHNPHCHLIFSERHIDNIDRSESQFFKRANNKEPGRGGAKKSTYANNRDFVKEVRKSWRESANKHLEKAGHNTRIDERTLAAQKIDREARKRLNRVEFAKLKKLELEYLENEKEIASTDLENTEIYIDVHEHTEKEIENDYERADRNISKYNRSIKLFLQPTVKDSIKHNKKEKKRLRSDWSKNRAILEQYDDKKLLLTKAIEEITRKIEETYRTVKSVAFKQKAPAQQAQAQNQEQSIKMKFSQSIQKAAQKVEIEESKKRGIRF